MAITIHDDGFSMSGRHAELFDELKVILQNCKGPVLDMKIGMFYDTWHAEFGEEVPDCVVKFIERVKKANARLGR